MGIDIGASVVVGLPKEKLEHLAEDYEDFGDWSESQGFDQVSPYFDACKEDCIFGVVIKNNDYFYTELGDFNSFKEQCEKAHEEFKSKVGLEGKLYLSPDVW